MTVEDTDTAIDTAVGRYGPGWVAFAVLVGIPGPTASTP